MTNESRNILSIDEYRMFREDKMQQLSIQSYAGWTAYLFSNLHETENKPRPKINSKPNELLLYLCFFSIRVARFTAIVIDRAMLSPSEQVVYDSIMINFNGKDPADLIESVRYCKTKMHMADAYIISFLHSDDLFHYSFQELESYTINKFSK